MAILAWHEYRGVIACHGEEAASNQFVTHWAEIPASGWVRADQVKPTAADADQRGCVLACHLYDGYRVTGWHQIARDKYYIKWQRTPKGPRRAANGEASRRWP